MDGAPATQQCCYRHPDREANVRCTRCNRPVCPECMVSASVGFQCPECVQAGHQGARAPRTAFGGRVGGSQQPVVTLALLAVNVVVWLLAVSLGDDFVLDLELVGRATDHHGDLVGVAEGPDQWYRLVTAMFLHQAVAHIVLNMLSLWWLGPSLESALGRARFLALYLLAGLGGSATSFLLADPNQGSLGASGAIFGLLGALGVVVHRIGGDVRPIVIVLVLNLALTFTLSGIDWRAHLGGLVAGVLVALGLVYAPRARRTFVQVATCGAMLVLIAVMVWLGTERIVG